MSADDTIVALSSGRPTAAIAVVRMSGPAALRVGEAIAGALPPSHVAAVRRLRHPADGSTLDHALVLCFAAPNSVTGENVVEFQCHGSRSVVGAVVEALVSLNGVRSAEPGEFTRRALANGKLDLTQAEGLADLLEAETEAQRKSALQRSEGAVRRKIESWRRTLLSMSARVEVAIDYVEEEDGSAPAPDLEALSSLIEDIERTLNAPRVEKLRDGVRVVVAGPPNAGKSSLVNALVGQQRSIVTAIPGTTRDIIEVPLAIGGIPFLLIDTAGLRDSGDVVEKLGIDLARQELERADIVLWLGAPVEAPVGAISLHAKADCHPYPGREARAVSAVTGAGIDELKSFLQAEAAGLLPVGDQLALTTREAILLGEVRDALQRAGTHGDVLFFAEELRVARDCLDQISGRAGVEDLLDALFSRFCLGK